MTPFAHSSLYPSKLFSIGNYRSKTLLVFAMMITMVSAAFAAPAANDNDINDLRYVSSL